jgi:hypothetical protein
MGVGLLAQRHQERHIIDAGRQVGENTAHPLAPLSMLPERKRALHQFARCARRGLDISPKSNFWPCRRSGSGLSSNVSVWLTPPFMRSWVTRRDLARWCSPPLSSGRG